MSDLPVGRLGSLLHDSIRIVQPVRYYGVKAHFKKSRIAFLPAFQSAFSNSQSPASYWNHGHYGLWFTLLEALLVLM